MTTAEIPHQFTEGWLSKLDGRTEIKKVMQARYMAFTNDLGGDRRLSYAQRSLVERALWLEYWLAQQEVELSQNNDSFDIGRWTQAVNSLQGVYSKLGLKRQAKDLDLNEYLDSKQ